MQYLRRKGQRHAFDAIRSLIVETSIASKARMIYHTLESTRSVGTKLFVLTFKNIPFFGQCLRAFQAVFLIHLTRAK